MMVECSECGKDFEKLPSEIKRTSNNFCSVSCASSYNGKKRRGPYMGMESAKASARELRYSGFSYGAISDKLEIPASTVRNWVCDIHIDRSKLKVVVSGNISRAEKPMRELRTNTSVRKRLIRDRGRACEICGLSDWMGFPIWLEVHHINGKENAKENVMLVCLNCHAMTDDYRSKNSQ